MTEEDKVEGAFSRYRVLDLTDEKGFLCGKILGDFGADVIKIERPGGDPTRSIGPFYHDDPDPEKSLLWWAFNTSKRGITLDIETAEDMRHDPQFKHRNHFLTFDHQVIGPHAVDALPFRLSRTPARQYLPDPCLGEHNAYVCTELLGMSDEEFAKLAQTGVFG